MSSVVIAGAQLLCTFGTAPSTLSVASPTALLGGKPIATTSDAAPLTNIAPFGLCTSLANPVVSTATAAHLGVLTPMPCVPATTAWTPGSATVLARSLPVVTATCTCMCKWAGKISIVAPGQVTTSAPD